MSETFQGFRPEAFQFLVDLAANNERSWFQPRKAEYERWLKQPLEALCVALRDEFARRKLAMRADPVKSPFRIYRDVRFSRDKSPYKTNLGASFPWLGADDDESAGQRHGGGYFHLAPEESFVGGGVWHPEPAWLAAWRRLVDQDPERVHAALDERRFRKAFPGGVLSDHDRLTRVPRGFAADHPDADLLKLRNVGFGRVLTPEEVGSPDLPRLLTDAFAAATPVFTLLTNVNVPPPS
ncbi:MAG: DUF2461 domain-containing protein [Chloroflexi bacterium]|nr:DUF2461 domain-containing protein [Chloroflexota bacterium]